jgi:ABC-type glycerol-3-phosphate transport system substrate-binding protein
MVKTSILLSAVAVSLTLAACGKPADPPKTAEQQKAEKDAATKTTRENPVYGDQLKAMDKAKAATEEANKKREEAVGTADDKLKSGY